MLGRVAFAQEKDASRAYLQGVRIESNGNLRLIATNGASLPFVDGPEIPAFSGVTIPTRMVAEAQRMTGALSGSIRVGISEGKISLTADDSTVISKLLDKALGYPDYMRVVPKSLPSRGTVKTAALVAAIRRAMISATEGKRRTVRLGISETGIKVTAHNSVSDAMDEIDAEFSGSPVELPFNPDLLIEILQSIPADVAEFECGADLKSATIWRAVGGEDGMVVAMPQAIA